MKKVKIPKKLLLAINIMLISLFFSTTVLAANYTVEVKFDGTNIEMMSPTPDMTWDIKKLQPGEKQYTVVSVSNTGSKTVDVEFSGSIASDDNIANILDIEILKLVKDDPSLDELIFAGKCTEMQNISFSLDGGKNQSYKIVANLPNEDSNEYVEKSYQLKLNFTSSGTLDVSEADSTTQDFVQSENRVFTSTIKGIESKEFKWVFVVIAILVSVFILLALSLYLSRDKKNKNYRIYKKSEK